MMAAMFAPLVNDTFLRACRRQATDRTPIWLMRQAGRYLPEYNATRRRAGSFLALAKSPELATEVTLQPIDRYRLDATFAPQPVTGDGHCGRNVRDSLDRIGAIGELIAFRASRAQSRTAANTIHLPLDLAPQRALSLHGEDLELDAGGTRIDDEDRIHGGSRGYGWSALTSCVGIKPRHGAGRHP